MKFTFLKRFVWLKGSFKIQLHVIHDLIYDCVYGICNQFKHVLSLDIKNKAYFLRADIHKTKNVCSFYSVC